MDSTGVVGKIQVSMMMMIIMQEGSCRGEDRGMVDMKLLKSDGVFQGDPRH